MMELTMHVRLLRILGVIVALLPTKSGICNEPVRAELVRLQKDTGLTLASFYRNVQTVDFADRQILQEGVLNPGGVPQAGALSRDGTRVALAVASANQEYLTVGKRDGTSFREYPKIPNPYNICWSFDHSALVVQSQSGQARTLLKLDLASGSTHEIGVLGYVTSQCWAPNDNQLVYSVEGSIRVYDLEKGSWRELTKGELPTWSPDGQWIAFLDGDDFYVIRPSGEEKKLLFKSSHVRSPLWWSPDSRFVAYVGPGHRSFWEILQSPAAVLQLRVRRLTDDSEDYVGILPDKGYVPNYQWIQPAKVK